MGREGIEEIGCFFTWHYKGVFGDRKEYMVHVYQGFCTDDFTPPERNDIGEILGWMRPIFDGDRMPHNLQWLLPMVISQGVESFNIHECSRAV